MGLFTRLSNKEPTIGRSSLTKSDLERLVDLDNDYRTDYTYVLSKSYRPDGSIEYENPRMFRRPINFYKRKWAFEKAWQRGYFHYAYYCVKDFISGFLSDPFFVLRRAGGALFFHVVQLFWSAVYLIVPRPPDEVVAHRRQRTTESTYLSESGDEDVTPPEPKRPPSRRRSFNREQRYSWSLAEDDTPIISSALLSATGDVRRFSPSPGPPSPDGRRRRAADRVVAPSSSPLSLISTQAARFTRTLLYVATLGFFPSDYSKSEAVEGRGRDARRVAAAASSDDSGREDSEPESSRQQAVSTTTAASRRRPSTPQRVFALLINSLFFPLTAVRYIATRIVHIFTPESVPPRRDRVDAESKGRVSSLKSFLGTLCAMSVSFVGGFFSSLASFPVRLANVVRSGVTGLLTTLRSPASAGYVRMTASTDSTRKRATRLGAAQPSDRGSAKVRAVLSPRRYLKECSPTWCFCILPIIFGVLLALLLRHHVDCDLSSYEDKSRAEQLYCDAHKMASSTYQQVSESLTNVEIPSTSSLKHISSLLQKFVRTVVEYVLDSVFAVATFFAPIAKQLWKGVVYAAETLFDTVGDLLHSAMVLPVYLFKSVRKERSPLETTATDDESWLASPSFGKGYRSEVELRLNALKKEKDVLAGQLAVLKRERELDEVRFNELKRAVELAHEDLPSKVDDEARKKDVVLSEKVLQQKIENVFHTYIANFNVEQMNSFGKRLRELEVRLQEGLEELSHRFDADMHTRLLASKEETGSAQNIISSEISDLGLALADLRSKFDMLQRDEKAIAAEFVNVVKARDEERRSDLSALRMEMKGVISDEITKGLKESTALLSQKTEDEREAFRSELVRIIEARLVAVLVDNASRKAVGPMRGVHPTTQVLSKLTEEEWLLIKKLVADELAIYDADKTGKVDYALESGGGSVLSTRCTEEYKKHSRLESVFGVPLWYLSYSPRTAIQHRSNTLAVGECWAFTGVGYLTVKLSFPIFVTEVSYEHVQQRLIPFGGSRSAPRRFEIWAFKELDDLDSKELIGEFEYETNSNALQFFPAQHMTREPVPIVELKVLSNWGADYTCLYRFRVHGRMPLNGTA